MMRFFRRKRKATLPPKLQNRVEQLPANANKDVALLNDRLIVLDVEATGLNTRKDNILAIGAVAIEHNAITLGERFYCVLNREHDVNQSVLIHGLGPESLAQGVTVEEGLLAFLEFIGHSPLFAFHAPYDQQLLTREMADILQYRLPHPFIDLAHLAPLLSQQSPKNTTLDEWLELLDVPLEHRHNALADAYATAKLLLKLLHLAKQQNITTLQDVQTQLKRQQQAHQPISF